MANAIAAVVSNFIPNLLEIHSANLFNTIPLSPHRYKVDRMVRVILNFAPQPTDENHDGITIPGMKRFFPNAFIYILS